MKVFSNPTTTPGDISHATDTSWEDVDVTAYVGSDAGSVAGVYLAIWNTANTPRQVGVKKNGSSDTFVGDLYNYAVTHVAIGVDSGDVFELYMEDASTTEVYMLGYWTTDEAEFLTDAQAVTPGSAETWTNTDLSSYFTGTVLGACLICHGTGALGRDWGAQDVDGPDRFGSHLQGGYSGSVVPCTTEACETYVKNISDQVVYCVGAITANLTKVSTSHNFTGSGSYEDIDLSGSVPAGGVAVIYLHHTGTGEDASLNKIASRPDDETWDFYKVAYERCYIIGALEPTNRDLEQKTDNDARDSYFVAYMTEPSGSSSITSKIHFYRQQQGVA